MIELKRNEPIDRLAKRFSRPALLEILLRRLEGISLKGKESSISFTRTAEGSFVTLSSEGETTDEPIEMLLERGIISPFEAELLKDQKLIKDSGSCHKLSLEIVFDGEN